MMKCTWKEKGRLFFFLFLNLCSATKQLPELWYDKTLITSATLYP